MNLYVPISDDAQTRLRKLATAERRTTRQQAAILIERALGIAEGESRQPRAVRQTTGAKP